MAYIDSKGEPMVGKIIGHVVLALIALVLFFGSWGIVGPGEQGIKVTLGKVSNNTLGQGPYFKMPILTHVYKVSTQTQTDNDKLEAASHDLQNVLIETVVNWHVKGENVVPVYQQYQGLENYTASVIAPAIRDAVKATSAKYTAEELVQKRDQFAADAGALLTDQLNDRGAVYESVKIVNFKFDDKFSQAIENKVVAEQDALAAKNKLAQVEYEAQQRVAAANGEAKAIAIQAQAIQSQGGKEYVNLKWVEKWNGQLPTTSLGNNTPLINIGQ